MYVVSVGSGILWGMNGVVVVEGNDALSVE